MNVLHVRTVSGTGGGPDKTILKSCRYLDRSGHRATAFYILDRRNSPDQLLATAEQMGVEIVSARESGPASFSTLRQLYRRVRRGGYDIVHCHDYKSNILIRLLQPWIVCASVTTAHGYNRTTSREGLYYRLDRWALRAMDAVIAPSQQMAKNLLSAGIPEKNLTVIYNGIDPAEYRQTDRSGRNGTTQLLFLGRLSREKDPQALLEAMAILKRQGVSARLVFAGDGPQARQLDLAREQHRLNDCVTFAGYVSDVHSLLSQSDMLVSSSRTECMPNAILEAMLYRLTVVATDVGGVCEMIRHEIDGLLCPSKDPEALAGAIRRLIDDPALADRLADNAHKRVLDEFAFEEHMRRTLSLYHRLMERK